MTNEKDVDLAVVVGSIVSFDEAEYSGEERTPYVLYGKVSKALSYPGIPNNGDRFEISLLNHENSFSLRYAREWCRENSDPLEQMPILPIIEIAREEKARSLSAKSLFRAICNMSHGSFYPQLLDVWIAMLDDRISRHAWARDNPAVLDAWGCLERERQNNLCSIECTKYANVGSELYHLAEIEISSTPKDELRQNPYKARQALQLDIKGV